jgi:hypothetical protein
MNLEFKVEFNANIEKVELRDVLFFLKKDPEILVLILDLLV